jgi:hypothetical protein
MSEVPPKGWADKILMEGFVSDSEPIEPGLTRHTRRPFPAYRHVPGRTPHPRRHPEGHSHGLPEPDGTFLAANDWPRDEAYLFAVDLYNYGFWWECHEVFESLWRAAGTRTREGAFFQGLLQVAAANLKRAMGRQEGAASLGRKGLARLERFEGVHRGLDVTAFARETRAWLAGARERPPSIRLSSPT